MAQREPTKMTKASPEADQELIRAIAELLNEQNLAEIEIEREDLRVRVTRAFAAAPQAAAPVYLPHPPQTPQPPAAPQSVAPPGSAANIAAAADELAANPGTLTSPMVGTA